MKDLEKLSTVEVSGLKEILMNMVDGKINLTTTNTTEEIEASRAEVESRIQSKIRNSKSSPTPG